jgi:putative tributyrin esterase
LKSRLLRRNWSIEERVARKGKDDQKEASICPASWSKRVQETRKRRWRRWLLVLLVVPMLISVGVGAFVGYDYCTRQAAEDTLYSCATDTAVNVYRTLWGNPNTRPSYVTGTGTVETKTFDSEALNQTMEYVIYLPPSYDDLKNSLVHYPVVYLLPGASGSTDTWVKAGDMAEQMDTLLAQGQVRPMILVVPQESLDNASAASNGGYVDGSLGEWGTYTTRDLVDEIDSSYRTVDSADGRAIAGDSEGAYGATNLGLKNPSEFGVVGSFSGYFTPDEDDLSRIFGGDQSLADANSPMLYLSKLDGELPAMYLLTGDQDSYSLEQTTQFADGLKARGAFYEFNTFSGGHNWNFWSQHLPDFLTFASEHLAQGG